MREGKTSWRQIGHSGWMATDFRIQYQQNKCPQGVAEVCFRTSRQSGHTLCRGSSPSIASENSFSFVGVLTMDGSVDELFEYVFHILEQTWANKLANVK